jgi:outer membrane phospholipase A
MNTATVRLLIGFASLLALATVSRADGLIVTAIPPAGTVAQGSEVLVGLMGVNPGTADAVFQPPAALHGFLRQGARSWPVELRQSGASGPSVAPGGFATVAFSLSLPRELLGQFILEISDGLPQPVSVIISVRPPTAAGGKAPSIAPGYSVVSLSSQPANSLLGRSFIDHFSVLDPMYFVYGTKAPAAKFQFSLKYRLLSFDEGPTGAEASSVQFGYTQRSLWNVNAHPSAFYDTSYMPSVFYQFLSPAANPEPGTSELTWLGFYTGYQHESNGQGGTLERSMNTLFVRSGLLVGRTDKWHSILLLRAFTYIEGVADNPEIKDYRGFGDWGVVLADGAGPSLTYTGWAGQKFNHGTTQLDLNIPIRIKIVDFDTFFLVQYFNGYGESFREYQAHSNVVRAGISLVR